MELVILILWLGLAVGVGMLSQTKTLGFAGGFLISILLSPLIGFVVYAVSMDKADKIRQIEMQQQQYMMQRQMQAQQQATPKVSTADELSKLAKLKEDGMITEEEYQSGKKKVLGI